MTKELVAIAPVVTVLAGTFILRATGSSKIGTPAALVLAASLLAGCDFDPEKALDFLSGRETNTVVLSDRPVLLTERAATFTSARQMKVLGESASLCLPLRGGVALQDMPAMDRAFGELMQGAKVMVYLTLSDGRRLALRKPVQTWRGSGLVAGANELSACVAPPCGETLPVGAEIRDVEIASTPPLQVQGIVWTSETDLVPKESAQSPAGRASLPASTSTCRR